MDGENRDDPGEALAERGIGADDNWKDRGMPIVRMNHVGLDNLREHRGRSAAKKDEPLQIVGVIAPGLAVNAVAPEEAIVLDQVEWNSSATHPTEQREGFRSGSDLGTEVAGDLLGPKLLKYRLVPRHHHTGP